MTPLLLGTALALAALAYVLAPLFVNFVPVRHRVDRPDSVPALEREVEALREIEFDHVTGKLSDVDYGELKDQYTERAVKAMRGGGAAPSCPVCGPRPETDPSYCSECGRSLVG
jgi:hypothetical protein